MEFQEVIKKRRTIRAYLSKPVEQEKLQKILETANLAPSGGNLQAREIFVVRDEQMKKDLARAALEQEFVAEAPVVVVFVANPSQSGRKYGKRGRELYSIQDATLSAFSAWLCAVDLGLSAAWVGAFDETEVVKILGCEQEWKPVVIMPMGYGAEESGSSERRPLANVVHRLG